MTRGSQEHTAEVVCFGMVTPAVVLIVDEFPEYNTGANVRQVADFISDDAAIIACLLRGWDVRSGLIGTALGNDRRGRRVARQLKSLGVVGQTRLSRKVTTPYEVNVSDRTGARTYFWQRDPHLLATLDTANLGMLSGASLLYVDWYDGDHILRPMGEATSRGLPVFLNLEYGHRDKDILARYASRATVCQAVTDPAQRGGDPLAVAQTLLDAGVETALVTLAGEGCLAMRQGEIVRAWAPSVQVVDGCGAGATFSAGYIYGWLQGWDLEAAVRLAVAAASIKCTFAGLHTPPLEPARQLAHAVRVERLAGTPDKFVSEDADRLRLNHRTF